MESILCLGRTNVWTAMKGDDKKYNSGNLNLKAVAKPNEDEINALTNLSVILQ